MEKIAAGCFSSSSLNHMLLLQVVIGIAWARYLFRIPTTFQLFIKLRHRNMCCVVRWCIFTIFFFKIHLMSFPSSGTMVPLKVSHFMKGWLIFLCLRSLKQKTTHLYKTCFARFISFHLDWLHKCLSNKRKCSEMLKSGLKCSYLQGQLLKHSAKIHCLIAVPNFYSHHP